MRFIEAIAWLAIEHGIRPDDASAICGQLRNSVFKFDLQGKELVFLIDGISPDSHLRDEQVNRTVSAISAIADVRGFSGGASSAISDLG